MTRFVALLAGAFVLMQPSSASCQAPPVDVLRTRGRPDANVRLGGVFLRGLSGSDPLAQSARTGARCSASTLDWFNRTCDVVGLAASTIEPSTFARMRATNRLLTPLLYTYASEVYDDRTHYGNPVEWSPDLARYSTGPSPSGHAMDMASGDWARAWARAAAARAREYAAEGVVVPDLPLTAHGATANLGTAASVTDRWLAAANRPSEYLLVPSALGFDALSESGTLPVDTKAERPALQGRLWDLFYPHCSGEWCEGWLHPYWLPHALPERYWEIEVEAAERAAYVDRVFIASAAYSSGAELKFIVASYLLAAHRQGRFVLQPMPLRPEWPRDAGMSAAVMQAEVERFRSLFNVKLGYSFTDRALLRATGGLVWRRPYQFGVVYVNSSDTRTVRVTLGSWMKTASGTRVKLLVLPPQSGEIVMYATH